MKTTKLCQVLAIAVIGLSIHLVSCQSYSAHPKTTDLQSPLAKGLIQESDFPSNWRFIENPIDSRERVYEPAISNDYLLESVNKHFTFLYNSEAFSLFQNKGYVTTIQQHIACYTKPVSNTVIDEIPEQFKYPEVVSFTPEIAVSSLWCSRNEYGTVWCYIVFVKNKNIVVRLGIQMSSTPSVAVVEGAMNDLIELATNGLKRIDSCKY
jgi:hypothetical protein